MTHGRIRRVPEAGDVAAVAAREAVDHLSAALRRHGSAVWVLAGGSSPMAAYRLIRDEFADSLDWSKVTAVMGDERGVPVDHPDSNWGAIAPVLFAGPGLDAITRARPEAELPVQEAARRYADVLSALPVAESGAPRFDLVWLGMGEDGHTLSLFPGHPELRVVDELVIPVSDSPKPPAQRITLTLRALEGAARVVIFATGSSKSEALASALREGELPVAVAAAHAVAAGAEVEWLIDDAAANG